MQKKEEMCVVVVERDSPECRRRSVQQLKYRTEEWCIEGTWYTENKR
jgi:hypothetical protein